MGFLYRNFCFQRLCSTSDQVSFNTITMDMWIFSYSFLQIHRLTEKSMYAHVIPISALGSSVTVMELKMFSVPGVWFASSVTQPNSSLIFSIRYVVSSKWCWVTWRIWIYCSLDMLTNLRASSTFVCSSGTSGQSSKEESYMAKEMVREIWNWVMWV